MIRAIAVALSLLQAGAAIHWALTGAVWSGGIFRMLVVVSLFGSALSGLLAVILFAIPADDAPKDKLEDAAKKRWYRPILVAADLVATMTLAASGHPWWGVAYLAQMCCEYARRGTLRELVKQGGSA